MNLKNIANLRLINQHIAGTKFSSAKEVVTWMGAMQAQDFAMVKWAVGVRLPNSTEKMIEAALDKGEIIRTHILRPTWHIVSADDLRWMLALTAPHIKRGMKSRQKDLGLTDAILSKSRKVIEKSLQGGKHATREDLIAALNRANINTDENRASHIFAAAELESLICSGASRNGKQTYSLLEEWVPATQALGRDEALAALAQRYFTSHGPATLEDFSWWSGLSAGDSKRGFEIVRAGFSSQVVEDKMYWFMEAKAKNKDTVHLLPAFDEFTISYKDRSATLVFERMKRAVSINGIFYPTVIIRGETVGTWKRTLKKNKVEVSINYFSKPDETEQRLVDRAIEKYGMFLEKEVHQI